MKRSSRDHTSAPIRYVAEPSADLNIRYVLSLSMPRGRPPWFQSFSPSPSRHMPSPPPRSPPFNSYSHRSLGRLATFVRILEKSHFVARSPHAKSAFPAQTNSPVMPGYTATITAQQPRAHPAKKTRHLSPSQIAGMMRILPSPRESPKRRLGVEQTVMTRCVHVDPSFTLLMSCFRLLGILRSSNS